VAGYTVLILKIAFLVVLWLFIAIVAVVIHHDMGGQPGKTKKPRPDSADATAAVPASGGSRRRRNESWVLAIDSGERAGERLQLVPEVRIGRSPQCELKLNDDFVSGIHAVLRHRSDGSWVITDAGSTNGTFVNTTKITEPTKVGLSDIIRIGDVQLRLEQA